MSDRAPGRPPRGGYGPGVALPAGAARRSAEKGEDLGGKIEPPPDLELLEMNAKVLASIYPIGRDDEGRLHSFGDDPAIGLPSAQAWFKHGVLHREGDLPAYVTDDEKQWFRDGSRHREDDLPACESTSGVHYWYRNGVLHREGDRPAVTRWAAPGANYPVEEWWTEGRLHREAGPAVVWRNGRGQFYIAGQLMPDLPTFRTRWRLASTDEDQNPLRLSPSNDAAWSFVVDSGGLTLLDDGSEFEVDEEMLTIALAMYPNPDDNWKPITPE